MSPVLSLCVIRRVCHEYSDKSILVNVDCKFDSGWQVFGCDYILAPGSGTSSSSGKNE